MERSKAAAAFKNEIRGLDKRIDKLNKRNGKYTYDTVKGSSNCLPFQERVYLVRGNISCKESIKKLTAILESRLQIARELSERIEEFINEIPDSEIRQIAEYYFVDALKVKDIPEMMGEEGSGTTQYEKLKKYMKELKV